MTRLIDIKQYRGPYIIVDVFNRGKVSTHVSVTRSSLIRAQRMQLKLYDAMKGQSPDEKVTG